MVVYWEQCGAGRSYDADLPPTSMTLAQFERDLDELVDLVRARFGKQKVILLGHSWGTALGTIYAAQHPDKVAAYVGVGQVANMPRASGSPTSTPWPRRRSGATAAPSRICARSDGRRTPSMGC